MTDLAQRHREFRLGVRVRLFNANLHQAIEESGLTRAQLAHLTGIPLTTLYGYSSFRHFPTLERRLKLAEILHVPIDSIFPESIEDIRLERQPEPLSFSREDALAAGLLRDSQEELAEVEERVDRAELIGRALDSLEKGPHHVPMRDVIIQRFGLDGEGSRTLDQVGANFGVSRERIRQVETKALAKLRHPSRSRLLRSLLYPDYLPPLRRPRCALPPITVHVTGQTAVAYKDANSAKVERGRYGEVMERLAMRGWRHLTLIFDREQPPTPHLMEYYIDCWVLVAVE